MREPRRPRSHGRLLDAAAALSAVVLLGIGSASVTDGLSGTVTGVTVVAALAMSAALAWRRSDPVVSAVVVYLGALAHLVVGVPVLPVDVLVLVSLYSVTVHGPVWGRRAALAGALLGSVLLPVALAGGSSLVVVAPIVGLAGVVLAVWALGLLRRNRLERVEALVERARRLESERDQQALLAAAAERTRIAREMHDVVAHSLSVVIAQADGGRYAAAHDPRAAEQALTTIAGIGRDALSDIRRILGVLREDDGTSEQPLSPQPAGPDLDALAEQVRAAGLPVSVVRMGTSRPLPAGAGLAVHRICQEALTNVLKHGGPTARATVLVQWLPHQVVLQVDDDGRGAAAQADGQRDGAGHGLVGMRERAVIFGGSLVAGPRPGGGFRVRAELPLAEQADAAGGAASTMPSTA